MEHLLEVKNLSISIDGPAGEVQAVRDVSFSLKKGEVLAIVGESGCGKSVLCKSIMKLLPPSAKIKEGSISVNGQDITCYREKEMQKLRGKIFSMIFQDPMTSLNPTIKIGKQIGEAVVIHNKNYTKEQVNKKVLELMELVGISHPKERYHQYPWQFSGGMRQRCVMAIALAADPDILFADEPTTALDVTIQAQILDLLKELRDKMNTSIILITHDLGVIAKMCDRVLVMYGGKVAEKGTVDEIFYETAHPYTAGLIKSIATLDTSKNQKLVPIDGTPPDLFAPPKGCPFAARCEFAMKVCYEEQPEFHRLSDEHTCACWLQHEYAPKVDIMKGLTEAQKQEEEENVAALPEEKRRGHHGKTN